MSALSSTLRAYFQGALDGEVCHATFTKYLEAEHFVMELMETGCTGVYDSVEGQFIVVHFTITAKAISKVAELSRE